MSTKITLSHPWQGHAVNETVELDDDRARQLVQAGAARYAKQPPAPAADVAVPSSPEQGAVNEAEKALASALTAGKVQGDSATKPATGTVTSL